MVRPMLLALLGLAVTGCDNAPASQSSPTDSHDAPNTTATAHHSTLSETVLHVEGMACQGCAEAAKGCLTGIDGVASADISFEDRSARVRYDASKTSPRDMVAALQAVDRGEAPSFEATVKDAER